MKNIIFLVFLFLFGGNQLDAQTADTLRWIIPMQEGKKPCGTPATNLLGFQTGNSIALIDAAGNQQTIPADSISWIQGDWWGIWQQGLKGIYHTPKGIIIPCMYEHVELVASDTRCWAFQVAKYGMRALVNDQNALIHPWQEEAVGDCRFVSDSILEFVPKKGMNTNNKKYISYNGMVLSDQSDLWAEHSRFKRIASDVYVFSWNHQGVLARDTFSSASAFVHGTALVSKGTRFGFLRSDGSWLIEPTFEAGSNFEQFGRAAVKKNEKWGIIRLDGSWVLEPKFEKITPKNRVLFQFMEGNKAGLVDSTGRVLLRAASYQKILTSDNGMFGVQMADSLLLYNRKGELMPLNHVVSYEASGNLAAIKSLVMGKKNRKEEVKGVLDIDSGKWILPQVYTGSITITDYFIILETKVADGQSAPGIDKSESGKYLLLTRQGDLILPTKLDKMPQPGKNPYVVFRANNKSGLVYKNKVVLEAQYDEINVLSGGWLSVRQDQKWGVVRF